MKKLKHLLLTSWKPVLVNGLFFFFLLAACSTSNDGGKPVPFMCGIVGTLAASPVNQLLYDALLLLQHRGQDAAGIVTMAASSV